MRTVDVSDIQSEAQSVWCQSNRSIWLRDHALYGPKHFPMLTVNTQPKNVWPQELTIVSPGMGSVLLAAHIHQPMVLPFSLADKKFLVRAMNIVRAMRKICYPLFTSF